MARPRSDIQPRILGAAAERFLHDGVDGASLRQIAHEAGTSVGMVSYYFATKDDLFAAVVEDKYRRLVEDFTAALAPDAPFDAQVERLYARLAALDDDEFRVARLVLREALVASPRLPSIVARFTAGHIPVALGAVLRAMAGGEMRDDVHPALAMISVFALGALPVAFRRLIAPTLTVSVALPSPDEAAATMRGVLLDGLRAPDSGSNRKGAKVRKGKTG